NSGELPTRLGREEVAIGGPNVRLGGRARSATKDVLVTHELSVVLADGPGGGLVSGIGCVRTGGPFPYIAKKLLDAGDIAGGHGMILTTLDKVSINGVALDFGFRRRKFPLRFGRQSHAAPPSVGIG